MEATAPVSLKYEEFEPSTEIVQERDCDTILLYVPSFKREKLSVQLTPTKVLRISGEREIENNKSICFQKEFPVSSNTDTNKIAAKFERGILYIRQPKLIIPEEKQDNKLPIPEPPAPKKPADKPESSKPGNEPSTQKNVEQKPIEKTSPKDGKSKRTDVIQDAPKRKLHKEELKAKNEKGSDSKDSESPGKKFQEEKTSFTSDDKPEIDTSSAADKKVKGITENVDGSCRWNRKLSAVDPAWKLKMARRVMNVVVVVLFAIVLGLYITNFMMTFRTAENLG